MLNVKFGDRSPCDGVQSRPIGPGEQCSQPMYTYTTCIMHCEAVHWFLFKSRWNKDSLTTRNYRVTWSMYTQRRTIFVRSEWQIFNNYCISSSLIDRAQIITCKELKKYNDGRSSYLKSTASGEQNDGSKMPSVLFPIACFQKNIWVQGDICTISSPGFFTREPSHKMSLTVYIKHQIFLVHNRAFVASYRGSTHQKIERFSHWQM
jgi:hypothetical protein